MKKKNRQKDILNCVYLPLAKKGRVSDLEAEVGAAEVTTRNRIQELRKRKKHIRITQTLFLLITQIISTIKVDINACIHDFLWYIDKYRSNTIVYLNHV
ncbi:MAG: hypothetical protein WBF33_28650 [Candidatus Nitrosopolaris sp.]